MAKKVLDRARRIELNAMGKSAEIAFNALNSTKMNLVRALNFYNMAYDHDKSKEWALSWIKTQDADLYKQVKGLKSWRFGSRGFFCKIIEKGYNAEETEISAMMEYFREIARIGEANSQFSDTPEEPRMVGEVVSPPVEDNNTLITQIEFGIDRVLKDSQPETISFDGVKKTHITQAKKIFTQKLRDIEYEKEFFINLAAFRRVRDYYQTCLSVLDDFGKSQKSPEKPKKVRRGTSVTPKPSKGLPYTNICDKQVAYVIDPRTKTVIVYRAEEGKSLDCEGVKVLNFSTQSNKKRLPAKQFDIVENTKSIKKIVAAFDSARTKISNLVPKRLKPEEHILVGVE